MRAAVHVVSKPHPKVDLGSRWQPGPVHRCDTEQGTYEHVNSAMESTVELTTQRALLLAVPRRVQKRIDRIQKLRGENWPGHYPEMS